jgi:hypothetical protein
MRQTFEEGNRAQVTLPEGSTCRCVFQKEKRRIFPIMPITVKVPGGMGT